MTDLVVIGRVAKAHGIRGEVVVDVLSDVPDRFAADVEVLLDGQPTRILGSRPHQGRLLVRFAGVDDRTAAELLRGRRIEAPAVDLQDEDTYYAHELVGMEVVDADERPLGSVTALIELPDAAGYDLLEVRRDDGSTWLLPAVDDYVEVTEHEGRERLTVTDPPEGLLSPDEAAEAAAEGAAEAAEEPAVEEGDEP